MGLHLHLSEGAHFTRVSQLLGHSNLHTHAENVRRLDPTGAVRGRLAPQPPALATPATLPSNVINLFG